MAFQVSGFQNDVIDAIPGFQVVAVAVAPPVLVAGAGGGKRRLEWPGKRRHRQQDLFESLEATIRLALVGDQDGAPMVPHHPVLAPTALAETLAQLRDASAHSAQLRFRLAQLEDDLRQYEAQRQWQAQLDDEDELVMLL